MVLSLQKLTWLVGMVPLLVGCVESPGGGTGSSGGASAADCADAVAQSRPAGAYPISVYIGNEVTTPACVKLRFDGGLYFVEDIPARASTMPGQYQAYGSLYWNTDSVTVSAQETRAAHEASQRLALTNENYLIVQLGSEKIQLDLRHQPPEFQ